ncbi:MAG: hypothetical protein AB7T49_03690 [Oligoflexales bacterium]
MRFAVVASSFITAVLGFAVGRMTASRELNSLSLQLEAAQNEAASNAKMREASEKKLADVEREVKMVSDNRVPGGGTSKPVETAPERRQQEPGYTETERQTAEKRDMETSGSSSTVQKEATWNQAEHELAAVTLANAGAFLKKAEISDLRSELRDGRPFQPGDQRIAQIQGSFAGDVLYLDHKQTPGTIEFDISATEVDGGRLKGSYSARMYRDGQRIGNSNYSGTLEGIMNTTSRSSALIVQLSPDSFAQLYYLPAADALVGNLYKNTVTDSNIVARLKLTR